MRPAQRLWICVVVCVTLAVLCAPMRVSAATAEVGADGRAHTSALSYMSAQLAAALAEVESLRAQLEGRPNCTCNEGPPARNPDDIHPDKAKNHELRDEIDDLYKAERDRQRRVSHDDADAVDNGPKEISIFCPKPPQINIVDLPEADRDNNECMVLNVGAPDLSSRLVLYCDGTTSGNSDGGNFEDEW